MVVHMEAALPQPLQEGPLGGHAEGRRVGHRVDEGREVAVGGDTRVLLAEAARRGVARVGKGIATGGVGVLVEAHETGLGHVDLAADLDARPALGRHARLAGRCDGARHVADGADVVGHVLARGAVATRGRAYEQAVAVGERHSQTVDLELAGVGDRVGLAATQGLVRAGEPLVQLVQVHRVVHGVHAAGVRDRLEGLAHVAAHALGVAVGRDELGMLALDGDELLQQAVELGVRHLRRVEGVVLVGRMVEDAAQLEGTMRRIRAGRRRGLGRGACRRVSKE